MNDPLMATLILLFLGILCCLLLVFLLVNIWQRQRAEDALHQAYAQLDLKTAQTMEAFRDSEVRFRLIAEAACDLLYEYDLHHAELTWFGDIDAALGFQANEFPRTLDAWQARIHPDDQAHLFEHALRTSHQGDALHSEYRIQTKQGVWIYWQDRSAVLFDKQGQPSKLLGCCHDVTALRLNELALYKNEAKYRQLIDSLGTEYFFYRHDTEGVFSYISASVKAVLGYSQGEFLFHYSTFFTDNPINLAAEQYTQLSLSGQQAPSYELEIYKKNGARCRLRVTEFPIFAEDGSVETVQGIAQDITQKYQANLLQRGRTDILEMIAQAQPLTDVLRAIIGFLESAQMDMLCCIMLLDAEQNSLSVAAAPSLPDFYSAVMEGIKVAEGAGACGTAAFLGKQVITEDILTHPYWADWRDLLAKTPLRSCWSEPIFSSCAQILGTFAMYYRTPRLPRETGLDFVQTAINLTAIAIDQQRHLHAVQESEKRLSTLIEAAPDAIYFKDGKGRWQVVNTAGLQAFNLQHAGWKGKTDLQLGELQPQLREAHAACFSSDEKAWQQGRAVQITEELIDASGNTHYFDVSKIPLFTPSGEREGLVIIGRNVTAQKQLEATLRDNQRYLQAALNASGAGTFLYDVNTDTNYWDQRSLAMFGLQADQFASNYAAWRELMHAQDLHKVEPIFQQALQDKEKETVEIEYRIVRPDQSIRHIKAQAWILRDEKQRASKVSGLHFDITASKQAEAELKQAKDEAEAANRAKSAFLATMSHELRTPLNGILGYAYILQQDSNLEDEQREQLQSIEQNGEHLLELINDVLDLSKIEAGKIELQPHEFLLSTFFREIAQHFTRSAANRQLEFLYQTDTYPQCKGFPSRVRADETRLRQILFNLLNNAIRFTQQGSVKLRVRYTHEHRMEVVVEDTGIGIAESDLNLIFLPFYQINRSQHQQGSGLGLAITYRLLSLMDAQLKVDSQVGKGSRFSFIMPLEVLSWEDNHLPVNSDSQHVPSDAICEFAAQVPTAILDDLCDMTELGDVSAILDYVARLPRNSHQQAHDFYARIIHLAQNFKIAELHSFLQQARVFTHADPR